MIYELLNNFWMGEEMTAVTVKPEIKVVSDPKAVLDYILKMVIFLIQILCK